MLRSNHGKTDLVSHEEDDVTKMLSLSMVEQMHDPDLTSALGRWGSSQEVGVNKLGVTCLRLAALCIAKTMHNNKPPASAACDIIEAYADYFHYYVHVGMEIIEDEAEKNKAKRRK